MNKHLKSILSLTIICIVTSILLALTNKITAPIIAKQESDKVNQSLTEVLPNGEDFKLIDLKNKNLPKTITEAYSEKNGGYVFKMVTTGYDVDFVILCGINKDGVVVGSKTISSKETLGHQDSYGKNLENKTLKTIDSVETISGATKTTSAYKNAVKDALGALAILNGDTVDLRTEEEILADNLNNALSGTKSKDKIIMVEEIKGIDSIYKSSKNNGFVFVIGKEFIGTDLDGNILTKTTENNKVLVENARQTLLKWADIEINLTDIADMPSTVKHVYKTDDGNYTFILNANGYGMLGGGDKYHPGNNTPIVIKVVASKEGKIIKCETISHAESGNSGHICAEESYYSKYNNKTENDYTTVESISGATTTSKGYMNAIGDVFTAIKLLKGVA